MTCCAAFVPRRVVEGIARERWELDDGDFLDVDRLAGRSPQSPLILVLHGLEGSSRAGYVRGVLSEAQRRGLAVCALNFRGCSGVLNRLPRFYHSGETSDLALCVARLVAEAPGRRLGLLGFSLGGNVVAKWLAELGDGGPSQVAAAVAISPPFDLARCAGALDTSGFWPVAYRTRFLRSLKRKALAKARRFPSDLDAAGARRAATFRAFDDAVTAPLHGFPDAATYWRLCSAGPRLPEIRRPLHVLVAEDDPFVPFERPQATSFVTVEATAQGGHVAFLEGAPWGLRRYAEARAVAYLAQHLGEGGSVAP